MRCRSLAPKLNGCHCLPVMRCVCAVGGPNKSLTCCWLMPTWIFEKSTVAGAAAAGAAAGVGAAAAAGAGAAAAGAGTGLAFFAFFLPFVVGAGAGGGGGGGGLRSSSRFTVPATYVLVLPFGNCLEAFSQCARSLRCTD